MAEPDQGLKAGVAVGFVLLGIGIWRLVRAYQSYMALAEAVAPGEKWSWVAVDIPPELAPLSTQITINAVVAMMFLLPGVLILVSAYKWARSERRPG